MPRVRKPAAARKSRLVGVAMTPKMHALLEGLAGSPDGIPEEIRKAIRYYLDHHPKVTGSQRFFTQTFQDQTQQLEERLLSRVEALEQRLSQRLSVVERRILYCDARGLVATISLAESVTRLGAILSMAASSRHGQDEEVKRVVRQGFAAAQEVERLQSYKQALDQALATYEQVFWSQDAPPKPRK